MATGASKYRSPAATTRFFFAGPPFRFPSAGTAACPAPPALPVHTGIGGFSSMTALALIRSCSRAFCSSTSPVTTESFHGWVLMAEGALRAVSRISLTTACGTALAGKHECFFVSEWRYESIFNLLICARAFVRPAIIAVILPYRQGRHRYDLSGFAVCPVFGTIDARICSLVCYDTCSRRFQPAADKKETELESYEKSRVRAVYSAQPERPKPSPRKSPVPSGKSSAFR